MFSSEGRYGYLETDLQSKKLVYAQLEMPKTFIHGDNLNVPITITNNIELPMYVTAKVHETRDGGAPTVKEFADLYVKANSFYSIPYPIQADEANFNKNISLKVELSQKARQLDAVAASA